MPYKDKRQQKEAEKKWVKEHAHQKYLINKKSRNKTAELIRSIKKTKKCKCGEDDYRCLDFHHRDPSTKICEVALMIKKGFSRKSILLEIEKCDVMCANCHRKFVGESLISPHYHNKNTRMQSSTTTITEIVAVA